MLLCRNLRRKSSSTSSWTTRDKILEERSFVWLPAERQCTFKCLTYAGSMRQCKSLTQEIRMSGKYLQYDNKIIQLLINSGRLFRKGNRLHIIEFLPPANEVCGKVMFLHASVRGATLPQTPHPHDMVNERAVRILLECIFVFNEITDLLSSLIDQIQIFFHFFCCYRG